MKDESLQGFSSFIFFCSKIMSNHELLSTATPTLPRRNGLRLRAMLLLGLALIVAAFLYNRYDASRPALPKPGNAPVPVVTPPVSGGSPMQAATMQPQRPD